MKAAVIAALFAIALAASGCAQVVGDASAQSTLAQASQAPAPEPQAVAQLAPNQPPLPPPPANYRQLAADYVGRSAPTSVSLQGAQISALRVAVAPQIGDYVACVSFSSKDGKNNGFIAVFYARGVVLTARRQVGVDHCEKATGYALLPKPAHRNGEKRKDGEPSPPDDDAQPESLEPAQ